MTITSTTLFRAAALAAVGAGAVFIGVQLGHPHLDSESITTTEIMVRSSFKVLMAGLAMVAITGMYLRQVREIGILGLVGYVVYAAGYLLISGTAFASAYVLPGVAESDPGFVDDIIATSTGGTVSGEVGAFEVVNQLQGLGYLAGGLLLGVAMYRANVLSRWASALLAVSGLVSAALTVMPDAFYRLLAFPNAVAMIGLGYSLWRSVPVEASTAPTTPARQAATAGAR